MELLGGVLAVGAAIIAAEVGFVAVIVLEEDILAAVEAAADTITSLRTHPHKADERVGEDSIAAATEELISSM